MLGSIFIKIFSFLFPPVCIICGTEETDGNLCTLCLEKFPIHRDQARPWSFSLFVYRNDRVSTAIQHLKNFPDQEMVSRMLDSRASMISSWTKGIAATSGVDTIILIPIPLHRSRFLDRGYNQTDIIAECIAKIVDPKLHIHILKDVIIKPNKTIKQATIHDRTERFKNIHGAFAIKNISGIKNHYNAIAIIVDDVTTTGGTLDEVKTLLDPYVKNVFAFTLGH